MASRAVVLFCDYLGFKSQSLDGERLEAAVRSLKTGAELLRHNSYFRPVGNWEHRFALSDSLFLTHPSPLKAVSWGAELVRELVANSSSKYDPVLPRGGLAYDTVEYLESIVEDDSDSANLIGPAVVRATQLEQVPLKGPRLLVEESLVDILREKHADLVEWLLRPTSVDQVWEVLWLLPPQPKRLSEVWEQIVHLARMAIALLRERGGHPKYGKHYRALAIFVGRCALRIAQTDEIPAEFDPRSLFPEDDLLKVLDRTSGIPTLDALSLRQLAADLR